MNKRVMAEIEQEEKAEKERQASVLESAADDYFKEPDPEPEKSVNVAVPVPAMFDPQLFAKAVGEAIAAAIPLTVKAMRDAEVDPEVERIKALRKLQMRETAKEGLKAQVDKWLSCSHLRTHPYTGTSRIGWATQSDGHTRGTCMGCGCPFTPIATELPDPERMGHLYAKYIHVPVSIAHNDFTSGMVVAGNPA